MSYLLSIVWNSIGIGDPAHGVVTKTVHKSLPGVIVWVGLEVVVAVGSLGGVGLGCGGTV